MATETNKRKLEANSVSPEGCKSKKSKKKCQKQRGNSNSESSVCCICNCVIEEDTDEKDGEDGIFVRVVVIAGYTVNVLVFQSLYFNICQIQKQLFCVFTAFCQIKLPK